MAGGGTPEEDPLGDTQGRGAPGTCSPPLNPRSISSSLPRALRPCPCGCELGESRIFSHLSVSPKT